MSCFKYLGLVDIAADTWPGILPGNLKWLKDRSKVFYVLLPSLLFSSAEHLFRKLVLLSFWCKRVSCGMLLESRSRWSFKPCKACWCFMALNLDPF